MRRTWLTILILKGRTGFSPCVLQMDRERIYRHSLITETEDESGSLDDKVKTVVAFEDKRMTESK